MGKTQFTLHYRNNTKYKKILDQLKVIYAILSNVLADSMADIKDIENTKTYSPLLPPFVMGITCAYLMPCEKQDGIFSSEIMILAQEEMRRKGVSNGENTPEFYIKAAINSFE